MRIDLHTHSSRSDGTDSPAGLVEHAAAAGIDVVGLTDHDTLAGWDDAIRAAWRHGVGLVVGVEISCRLAGASVHMLAYLVDPTHPGLLAMLEWVRDARAARVPALLDRLRSYGMDLTMDDVAAHAPSTASVGRPHVADALVSAGYVADRQEAFERWLGEGRPAYVPHDAPEPTEVIRTVLSAGGVPVLAHPRGRKSRTVLTDQVVRQLTAAGMGGIEVDHHDHPPDVRAELRALAAELDLVVTGSSDYHGRGKVEHELGCHTTTEEEFARLLDRARTNAERAQRRVPEFIPPRR